MTERRLDWDGCANVRDLGGHARPGGRRTAFGSVVRSESIGNLTDRGWEQLVAHGIRTIIDLRFASERDEDPPRELPVAVVHAPIFDEADEEAMAAIDGCDTTAGAYVEMLERFAPNFAVALTAIGRAPAGGVVVHCRAGKDRTGLVVALLLTLAGVPPEDIAVDYGLSEPNIAHLTELWVAEAPDEAERDRRRRVSRGEPQAMLDVLGEIEARYGSVRGYLLAAGASKADLEAAARRLAV